MTRKLDISFSIVDGQIQEYQNEKFAIFVLNIQNTEDLQKITEYLDAQKITWRVLDKTQEDEDGEV
jgi:ABC-type methionine transport system ATPase subunit